MAWKWPTFATLVLWLSTTNARRYQEILVARVFLYTSRILLLTFLSFNVEISWVEERRYRDFQKRCQLLWSLSMPTLKDMGYRLTLGEIRVSSAEWATFYSKRLDIDRETAAANPMVNAWWRYLQEISWRYQEMSRGIRWYLSDIQMLFMYLLNKSINFKYQFHLSLGPVQSVMQLECEINRDQLRC